MAKGAKLTLSIVLLQDLLDALHGLVQDLPDPRAQMGGDTPFNMQRMIYGGFEVLTDSAGELNR